jgi:hypothetical protein
LREVPINRSFTGMIEGKVARRGGYVRICGRDTVAFAVRTAIHGNSEQVSFAGLSAIDRTDS